MNVGRPASADPALVALFLATKLLATLGWLLASIRLAADPLAPSLLRLGKHQLLWLGFLLLLMPLALAARLVLQKLIGAALAPIGPDPRTVLLLAILACLALFLYLQARLMPALIGVLLGTAKRAALVVAGTQGRGLTFVAAIALTILPLFAIHFGNSLVWLPKWFAVRLAVLVLDGVVMAALLLAGSAAYAGFYETVKKARGIEADLKVPAKAV